MTAHEVSNFADDAIAVGSHHLNDHPHAAWTVAFEIHFLILFALDLSGAALDGSLDILIRHVLVFGSGNSRAEPGVGVGIATTDARRNRDFADQFGENAPPFGVGSRLFVFNRRPF